jgi:anionic cell wall polymer biosynthesis LytR-Cps2A-Psr (LCP) family protein
MQELLLRVSEIIGFEPDGYAVVDLSVFEQLVDLMGGITFDVPVDMHYSDPTQGLNIEALFRE